MARPGKKASPAQKQQRKAAKAKRRRERVKSRPVRGEGVDPFEADGGDWRG